MNRSILTTLATLGLLAVLATTAVGDDASVITGTSTVGAHFTDVSDHFDKVGEYFSDADADEYQAHAVFDFNGVTATTIFDLNGFYRDRETKGFGFDLNSTGRVNVSFDYQSFVHHLGHDLLENMQAREALPDNDDDGLPQPGGKQVYHDDMDPLGRYWLQYSRMNTELSYDIKTIDNGTVWVKYGDQHRSGWKQALTIDHCATCHVESNRRRIDEQTRSWAVGAEGTVNDVTFNYEFQAQDFTDYTDPNMRTWTRAQHPVRGGLYTDPGTGATSNYVVEFGSRLGFHDVTLPYAAGPTSEKRSHQIGLKMNVNEQNLVKGSYSHNRVENKGNNLASDVDAYAAAWVARPNRKTRLTARALIYEVKADDALVDLMPYRNERPGGGQDFDWTRISAANREVLQTDMALRYKLAKGSNLSFDWRHKVVDRDAMNQTQTSYYQDAAGENVEVASQAVAQETTTDRFRASWRKRFGRKGNAKLQYTYTTVDQQFANVQGICEDGLHGDTHNLAENDVVYYFQRERVGNATALPNKSHRITARTSYQLSPRASLNAYVNFADEENDELNSYAYERSVLSPGANLWFAPSNQLMLTMGYSFNSVESNALFCPPLFGG